MPVARRSSDRLGSLLQGEGLSDDRREGAGIEQGEQVLPLAGEGIPGGSSSRRPPDTTTLTLLSRSRLTLTSGIDPAVKPMTSSLPRSPGTAASR